MQTSLFINLILLSLIFVSCTHESPFTPAIYLLADTTGQSNELKTDYLHHLRSLEDYFTQKEVKAKLLFSKALQFDLGRESHSIRLGNGETFRMIMVNSKGEIHTVHTFGTDVDLMMEVNAFLNRQ